MRIYRNGHWSTTPFRWSTEEAAIKDLDLVIAALQKAGYVVVEQEQEVKTAQ
jgi:hypothetical protein